MKNKVITAKKIIKTAVKKSLANNANSTTCVYVYQPKAPAALKQFSKVENDK